MKKKLTIKDNTANPLMKYPAKFSGEKALEMFRKVRDEIKEKVEELIKNL